MSSCFVCPLYLKEKDYNYALDMYESKIKYNITAPIYFVFSYKEHELEFKKQFRNRFSVDIDSTILLPEELLKYKCQVTTKKLYGVFTLQHSYDYIAAIDCECLFVQEKNVDKVFEEIWENGSLTKCNKSYLLQHLLKNCVENLNLKNKKFIKEATCGYIYNCWFNEIPVYKTKYTEGFFDWFMSNDWESILNNYYMLDYYLYLLYLIDNKIISISYINYWAPLGIMEEISFTNVDNAVQIEEEIGTHWTSNEKSNRKDLLMRFHLDHRPSNPEIKDFIKYSKYKRWVWILFPNGGKSHVILEKIIQRLLKTNYYKKYGW